jgi:hypothetical protein
VTAPHQPTEAQRARALRLRHKHERQAVVFGAIIAGLVVVGLIAAAVYTGKIPSPFHRAFSTPTATAEAALPTPCLPKGTPPVAYKDVGLRVLNGTVQSGLASTVATALKDRGFNVIGTGNFTPRPLAGTARVVTGVPGLAAAYTLAAQVLDARVVLDGRADASVDLAVGTEFKGLLDPAKVGLSPDKPMTSGAGCVPADSIVVLKPAASASATKPAASATP